jgi:aspartate/methionine/tyrosine aminotransferase
MFSSRVPGNLEPNRLSRTLAQMRRDGAAIIDLTESNPTRAGFAYPPDLLAPLGDARGLAYRPSALGLLEARRAVSADFARRGVSVDPAQIALTASTSEAYSLLFKVLCDPGDEVLIPRPSYPLFEHLTRLDAVRAVPYDVEYHVRWSIDLGSVERALTPRTRAVLLVNPNNPTGNYVSASELDWLAGLCGPRSIAIISDEVFTDYALVAAADGERGVLVDRRDVLGFTLGGLSKTIGLPQAKLGWIAASGRGAALDAARARLELACDTYLSVSTPVQYAAAELLERGADVRRQIHDRVRRNLSRCASLVAASPACALLRAEGGWYAVLQVPSLGSEEELMLALLTEDHVLAHAGYFFDFATESFLIVSLLAPEDVFERGVTRVLDRFTMEHLHA